MRSATDLPALGKIGMIELLECDSRPTFILDLERTQDPYDEHLHTDFSNASLQRLPRILDSAQLRRGLPAENSELEQYSQFKEWATSSSTTDHIADGYTNSFEYQDLLWTTVTLRKRWRIISGSAIGLKDTAAGCFPSPPAGPQKRYDGTSIGSKDILAQKESGKLQAGMRLTWVDDLPISKHVQFFKSRDWSATPLGPLETWSICLRQMTYFLMSDSRASCMFWYKLTYQSPHESC